MRPRIIAGTRGSKLALIQTESVVARIKKANPRLEIDTVKINTAGDRDRQTSLDRMGVAVFVKELEDALLDHRIDLAVHSLKDVPTELPPGLCLLAIPERIDPRDVLVAKSKLEELTSGSSIGTDSLRRRIQLARLRPDLTLSSMRGNIDTRLKKVASGEVDGAIMAAAGLLRMGWEGRITETLSLDQFLPAVGQGALAVEARSDDKDVAEIVSPLNDVSAWRSVMAERAFLLALGGGCRAPIAALGMVNDSTLELEGMVASPDGAEMLRASEKGNAAAPEEIGLRLARRMLEMGASRFIDEIKRNENR